MNKLKTFIIIGVFLLTSIPSFVFAQTFNDVAIDAWYYDYVEQLVDDGVVDTAVNYRPDNKLTRAELVKMIIVAINGLAEYEIPVIPTFDDVSAGAWYYDYIEAAVQLKIIDGYKDKNGHLTGYFGPNDSITRAETTKILINAFSIPTDLDPASTFPDVAEDDWFYNYVVTAYNQSILDGYANGYFGSADPVTRAQVAKLVVNAMGPVIVYEDEEIVEEVGEEIIEEAVDEEADEGIDAVANTENLESGNLMEGANEQFAASYNFSGLYEGFYIQTLTVVNDLVGNNFGDNASSTAAVKNVIIKYPDENDKLQTHEAPLGSDGKARFTDLSFYTKRDGDAFLEIYADLNSIQDVGESFSGKTFRLGLQNVNNDISSFKAVGESSGESTFSISYLSDSGASEIFTVRKSIPEFEVTSEDSILINGEENLIKFNISADSGGSVGFGRITFNISVSDNSGAGLQLNNFKLLRGSSLLDNQVNIYDATGGADITEAGGGLLGNGVSNIIVSFNQEETSDAGSSNSYTLKANMTGVESDDSISTKIGNDDRATPLSGLTANTNENTGKIYVNGDASDGIFTNATDFSQALGTARNIIWSDKSADIHNYPTITAGSVSDGSGSYDWTNGYLLNTSELPTVSLSK